MIATESRRDSESITLVAFGCGSSEASLGCSCSCGTEDLVGIQPGAQVSLVVRMHSPSILSPPGP